MGIFDDAKTVMIGNKEVQSIITSNGGVIYEKPSGYKLTLTADKSIIQTNELCTLSATLTNNNTPMAGETIFFYDSNNPPISYSTDGSHDFTVNVGDAFKLYYTSQSTASNSYCAIRDITNSISIYVHKEGNVSITETNISRTTTFNSFSYLKLENGILSNGDGDTCDLSSYTLDFDLVRINNSGTVYVEDDLIGVAITNVNGVATVGYTGKGTGDLNIKSITANGIIQSEIFEVLDSLLYDPATTFDTNKWNNQGVTATYNSETGTTITTDTDYRYASKYSLTDGLIIEFDLFIPSSIQNNPNLYIRGQSTQLGSSLYQRDVWHKIRIELGTSTLKIYCDGDNTVDTTLSNPNATFQFRVANQTSISFKNFVIYPI